MDHQTAEHDFTEQEQRQSIRAVSTNAEQQLQRGSAGSVTSTRRIIVNRFAGPGTSTQATDSLEHSFDTAGLQSESGIEVSGFPSSQSSADQANAEERQRPVATRRDNKMPRNNLH